MCWAKASSKRTAVSICSVSHSCKASQLPWYLRRGAPGQECPLRQVPVFLYACALVSAHYFSAIIAAIITIHTDFVQMELRSKTQFGVKVKMQAHYINTPLKVALELTVYSVIVHKLTKELLRGNFLCSCETETACTWTFHPALLPIPFPAPYTHAHSSFFSGFALSCDKIIL